MAKITFSLEELLKILISNELLPRQIIRVRVKGQRIHFIIRTDAFILPYIPASLRYISFDNNNAIFELTIASGHLNKAVNRLNQALKLKIPDCMKLEYPNISVDIDRLLEEKNIKGVRVKDIFFENGDFTIVSENI
ncbi:MAG: hypothetical protein IIC00_04980 [Planctomycetes bacterium]|nr:hypothetical protein [Planctomycetota bacterium]